MRLAPVSIVLADISGYTRFIKQHTLSILHAERIVTELLEAVIDGAKRPLSVSEVEGDAVFFYAVADQDARETARDVQNQALRFFDTFQRRSLELVRNRMCPCEGCNHIPNLKLKVICHHGSATIKQVRQFRKVSGENVIIAHRLLKNSIEANQYLLMTEDFYRLSGGIEGSSVRAYVETYQDIGEISVRVYFPTSGEMGELEPTHALLLHRLKQHALLMRYTFARLFGKNRRSSFRNLPDEKPDWRGMF